MLTVTLCSSNRPPNLLDGSTEVTPAEGTGGDPASSARTPRSSKHTERSRAPQAGASTAGGGGGEGGGRRGEPDSDSPTCFVSPASLDVFRSRSIFRPPRRSSSGYFSFDCDSLPSSPLSPHPVTADKATQTPSLTGQVMNHALQRMAVEHGGLGLLGHSPNHYSTINAARDMQSEIYGRQLRAIGDDFNNKLMRMARGHQRNIVPLNLMPHIQQEPVAMLCVCLLLLLVGRIMYMQGNTSSHDHSQV
ncbi:bcl-2-like protein 11 isoform X2 [Xiphophorus hellerii]|uniref:bcl-2-like protein 11 isoform X2 n=1 Tax=Xiphophorus hellerii TaxID=8084 RepID=UPI0013B444DA|nr:bcl-2-like protein 11 isoform X2 [Xiphophorus hellerii]